MSFDLRKTMRLRCEESKARQAPRDLVSGLNEVCQRYLHRRVYSIFGYKKHHTQQGQDNEDESEMLSIWQEIVSARVHQVRERELELRKKDPELRKKDPAAVMKQPHFAEWAYRHIHHEVLSCVMEQRYGVPSSSMQYLALDLGLPAKTAWVLYLLFGAGIKGELSPFLRRVVQANPGRNLLREAYPRAVEIGVRNWIYATESYGSFPYHAISGPSAKDLMVQACRELGYALPAEYPPDQSNVNNNQPSNNNQPQNNNQSDNNNQSARETIDLTLRSPSPAHNETSGDHEGGVGSPNQGASSSAPGNAADKSTTSRSLKRKADDEDCANVSKSQEEAIDICDASPPRAAKRPRTAGREDAKALTIEQEDLNILLDDQGWLNGQTISTVLRLLTSHTVDFASRELAGDTPFKNLIDGCTSKGKSNILIPINVANNSHWVLCHIEVEPKRISIYDSMAGTYGGERCREEILRALNPTRTRRMVPSGWTLVHPVLDPADPLQPPYCPQQTNASDCGVYVLAFALHIILTDTQGDTTRPRFPDPKLHTRINARIFRRLFASSVSSSNIGGGDDNPADWHICPSQSQSQQQKGGEVVTEKETQLLRFKMPFQFAFSSASTPYLPFGTHDELLLTQDQATRAITLGRRDELAKTSLGGLLSDSLGPHLRRRERQLRELRREWEDAAEVLELWKGLVRKRVEVLEVLDWGSGKGSGGGERVKQGQRDTLVAFIPRHRGGLEKLEREVQEMGLMVQRLGG